MLISSSSILNRVFRWPEVYRNATYGRLIVLVTRLLVRNDYFHHMHILESKATLLELLVSTDQRMRCPRFSPLWPDCNIRERERIPSFWSVDTINCEWLVQVSRFSCFAFRVSQSIIRIAVEKKEPWHVAFFNNASVARSFNSASRMESSVIDFRKV